MKYLLSKVVVKKMVCFCKSNFWDIEEDTKVDKMK